MMDRLITNMKTAGNYCQLCGSHFHTRSYSARKYCSAECVSEGIRRSMEGRTPRPRLMDEQVRAIRREREVYRSTWAAIAKRLGLPIHVVQDVLTGRTYRGVE